MLRIFHVNGQKVYFSTVPPDEVDDSGKLEYLGASELKYFKSLRNRQKKAEYLHSRLLMKTAFLDDELEFLKTDDGDIIWPKGTAGSLTHKKNELAFSYVEKGNIGIDLELSKGFNLKLEKKICDENESKLIDEMLEETGLERGECLAIVFSFKESVFKCLFPIGRIPFHFKDFEVTKISEAKGEIIGILKKQVSPKHPVGTRLKGNYGIMTVASEEYVFSMLKLKK